MTAGARPIRRSGFSHRMFRATTQNGSIPTKAKQRVYLAMLVCRYMNELQRKDKKVVLSAKALEAIYHTASSSVGKLISGKQYLGGLCNGAATR